ncbi:MAG: hypothetical protein RLZZ546_2140 [Bacteroidota bacterium]|jgi:TusA-related sulfurtransferase
MNKFLIPVVLVISLAFKSKDPAILYIKTYHNIAIKEMDRTGIPASIKLAQALLESDYGKSLLATSANNHFGLKCGSQWTGKIFHKLDDDQDVEGNLVESCFRAYENADESFIAHSDFLKDPKKKSRYGFLFQISHTDYQSWAIGLKNAGYASDPLYPEKLIKIIEKYELHKFDSLYKSTDPSAHAIVTKDNEPSTQNKMEELPTTINLEPQSSRLKQKMESTNVSKKSFISERKNGILAIKILEPISVEEIAHQSKLKSHQLIAFNELVESPTQIIEAENYIYLSEKKRDYTGIEELHTVKEGETLEIISNLYGIQAHSLYSLNKIPKSCIPLPNEKISLKSPNKYKVRYQRKIKNKAILF